MKLASELRANAAGDVVIRLMCLALRTLVLDSLAFPSTTGCVALGCLTTPALRIALACEVCLSGR
jgi:hypothetical protein